LCARREPRCDFERLALQLGVVNRKAHEADALGLLARQTIAEQQIVFGLGHSAQQRPHDGRVIAGGNTESRMAVDDDAVLGRDRYVPQEAAY
jgi:hypothetical protein